MSDVSEIGSPRLGQVDGQAAGDPNGDIAALTQALALHQGDASAKRRHYCGPLLGPILSRAS